MRNNAVWIEFMPFGRNLSHSDKGTVNGHNRHMFEAFQERPIVKPLSGPTGADETAVLPS